MRDARRTNSWSADRLSRFDTFEFLSRACARCCRGPLHVLMVTTTNEGVGRAVSAGESWSRASTDRKSLRPPVVRDGRGGLGLFARRVTWVRRRFLGVADKGVFVERLSSGARARAVSERGRTSDASSPVNDSFSVHLDVRFRAYPREKLPARHPSTHRRRPGSSLEFSARSGGMRT